MDIENTKKKYWIRFHTIDDIIRFVQANNKMNCEVGVYSGNIVLNGRSLMDMFVMDISCPIKVVVMGEKNDTELLEGQYKIFGLLENRQKSSAAVMEVNNNANN